LEKSAELQRQYTNVADLVCEFYLSESHFADRANGCALVALGGDMARSKGVRSGATSYVRSQLEWLAGLFRGPTAVRRRRAISTLAGVVGALTLARAVEDPTLSDEILSTARQVFGSARPAA
jgi:TetR/AcrR family transcriptional repressor of nem operon